MGPPRPAIKTGREFFDAPETDRAKQFLSRVL